MIKRVLSVIGLALLFASATQSSLANQVVKNLVAGQSKIIGTVTVSNDGTNLSVVYEVTDPDYGLWVTNLYIGKNPPKKAAPGSFPYHHKPLNGATEDTFAFSLASLGIYVGDKIYISAHADVRHYVVSPGGICPPLPSYPVMATFFWDNSTEPYFMTTISGAGTLDGTYDGWCVDSQGHIANGDSFQVNMYCSYNPNVLDGSIPVVDNPANLPAMNWLLNNFGLYPAATWREIQMAIWTLLDFVPSPIFQYNAALVTEIVVDALGNPSYQPGVGEKVAVLLKPTADGKQPSLIMLPVPSVPVDDTAWALPYDTRFSTGWGGYFGYWVTLP